jgi:hypothetical protein
MDFKKKIGIFVINLYFIILIWSLSINLGKNLIKIKMTSKDSFNGKAPRNFRKW